MSGQKAAIITVQRAIGRVCVLSFQTKAFMVPTVGSNSIGIIPYNCMFGFERMFRQSLVFPFTKDCFLMLL